MIINDKANTKIKNFDKLSKRIGLDYKKKAVDIKTDRFYGLYIGVSNPHTSQMPFRVLHFGDTTDICDILRLRRDNSTIKYYFTTFVIFEFH
jgi:hypothetical protein